MRSLSLNDIYELYKVSNENQHIDEKAKIFETIIFKVFNSDIYGAINLIVISNRISTIKTVNIALYILVSEFLIFFFVKNIIINTIE